jgi:hypothetical protein
MIHKSPLGLLAQTDLISISKSISYANIKGANFATLKKKRGEGKHRDETELDTFSPKYIYILYKVLSKFQWKKNKNKVEMKNFFNIFMEISRNILCNEPTTKNQKLQLHHGPWINIRCLRQIPNCYAPYSAP